MNPDLFPRHPGVLWDTPAFWAKRREREALATAKLRIRRERPERTRRAKIAKASKRRNRA